MSSVSARLRASLRLRLAVLGAAALLLVSAGGLIAATTSSPGPFTGCLSSKLGLMYNVAQGATPKAACFKGDTVVTFSNAQGPAGATGAPGRDGVSPTVAEEPPGANCEAGGYAVTDATGTVYACNGAPGQPGPGSTLMVDDILVRTSAAPGYSKITVACPGDEQVTGGGYATIGLTINSSAPGIHNTWVVAVTNPTSGPVDIDVTAVCAWLQ